MPHIDVANQLPGIVSLFAFRPETEVPLSLLAQTLLRGESTLTEGERELIAAYVSHRNECEFCHGSHAGAAKHFLDWDWDVMAQTMADPDGAPISEKMRALLKIAGKVQQDGRLVTDQDVALARNLGATDIEIHDTVLIAAAFCMYNRYVDGLASMKPDPAAYDEMGKMLATQGYVRERPRE